MNITQFLTLLSIIIFMVVVFPRRIQSKSDIFINYFGRKKSLIRFLILSFAYFYLAYHLFINPEIKTATPIFELGSLFAIFGLGLASLARLQLRKSWSPLTNTVSPFAVIDTGMFRFIRHPIYTGRFLFFLGVMMMTNPLGIYFSIAYWYILRSIAFEEEKFLLKNNPDYRKYMKKVPDYLFILV